MLASGGVDNQIKIWNVKTGQELLNIQGHEHLVSGVKFSHDGKKLVSSSFDKTLKIWELPKVLFPVWSK